MAGASLGRQAKGLPWGAQQEPLVVPRASVDWQAPDFNGLQASSTADI